MAVAYASSAGASLVSLSGATLTVTKPSGTVEGDLLLVLGVVGNGVSLTPPSGWTTAVASSGVHVFWKVASSSEPSSYNFTRANQTNTTTVVMVRITGAHATAPIDAISASGRVGGTSLAIPGLTAATGTYLFQLVADAGGVTTTWTPPGTATEDFDTTWASANKSSAGGHETITAGATGTRTWTTNNSGTLAGAMFAIVPEPSSTAEGSATAAHSWTATATGIGNYSGSATTSHEWTSFALSGVIPDSVALAQVRAAIANRENERVNIGMFGASVVEGYPSPIDLWIEMQLADKLRTKYPTSDIGTDGGYGFIGIPTFGLENTATTPVGYVPGSGTFSEAVGFGGRHRVWFANAAQTSPGIKLTMPDSATKVVMETVGGASGHAVGGRYRINSGTWVTFNTYAPAPQTILIDLGPLNSGDLIEVAHNTSGTGNVVVAGWRTYKGDENKGIQVHNHGHYGYRIADWNVARGSGEDPLWFSTMIDYDLIIMSDFGANDGSGPGDLSAADFGIAFAELIDWMRSCGYTGDLIIASLYNIESQRPFIDPWSDYVDQMRLIAVQKGAAFVQLDQYMSPPPGPLYAPDNLHGNADGSANDLMSDLYFARIAVQEGSAEASWSVTASAEGKAIPTGSATESWTVGGTAHGKVFREGTASSSWTVSGSASGEISPSGSGSEAWVVSSTASGKQQPQGEAVEGWTVGGTATGRVSPTGEATGSWSVTGSAEGFADYTGSAEESWTVAVSGSGKHTPEGSGIIGWNASSTGEGVGAYRGSAESSYSFSVSAFGGSDNTGVAHSHWNVTAEANGLGNYRGEASADWSVGVFALGGSAKAGSAEASWNVTASAEGEIVTSGSAQDSWSVTASAEGNITPEGSATDAWVVSGSAEGESHLRGSGTISHEWSCSAEGTTDYSGFAESLTLWSVSAEGRGDYSGSAEANWTVSSSATSISERIGSAETAWSVSADAAGKKVPKGSCEVIHTWDVEAAGSTDPRGSAESAHTWSSTAEGIISTEGYATAAWTVIATAYGPVGIPPEKGYATITTTRGYATITSTRGEAILP